MHARTAERRRGRTLADRLAAGFLLVLLMLGSFTLWVGIPLGGLWGLSKLTDSGVQHFVIGLLGVPLAMVIFAPFLFWLNGLYLRVAWARADEEEDDDEERPVRGPLEPMLVASFVIAVVALIVWFFGFAQNPPQRVW